MYEGLFEACNCSDISGGIGHHGGSACESQTVSHDISEDATAHFRNEVTTLVPQPRGANETEYRVAEVLWQVGGAWVEHGWSMGRAWVEHGWSIGVQGCGR